MPVNVLMPALSPTMEKGKLAKWLKKEGDAVKSGDVLAEIETDKATMEVEAVDEGTVGKLLVPAGTEDVAVNTPIAVILGEGEKMGDAPKPVTLVAGPKPAASAAPSAVTSPVPSTPVAAAPAASAPKPEGARVFASPLARRVAKQKGIDIAALLGSGPHGRIVLKDVESAKPGAAPAAKPAAGPALAVPPSDEQVLKLFAEGSYELVPHDTMRKVIARRLVES
ncbi:biotin/lipoyl-containing protein, partial [Aestuariivirga sp.]|uniref:biotin/lipoyl-containing protein n=1 Tax=Aestuariivirga sp. TaxID=2650926 RepID=UPI0035B4B198